MNEVESAINLRTSQAYALSVCLCSLSYDRPSSKNCHHATAGPSMPGRTTLRAVSFTARTSVSFIMTKTSPANTRLDTSPTRILPKSLPPAQKHPTSTQHILHARSHVDIQSINPNRTAQIHVREPGTVWIKSTHLHARGAKKLKSACLLCQKAQRQRCQSGSLTGELVLRSCDVGSGRGSVLGLKTATPSPTPVHTLPSTSTLMPSGAPTSAAAKRRLLASRLAPSLTAHSEICEAPSARSRRPGNQ